MRELLERLVRAAGPSGDETAAAQVWSEAAAGFAQVRQDALGNSFATVNSGGSPRIALVGHIDEIGFRVRSIDDTGELYLNPVGMWNPAVALAQRALVLTQDGLLPGVIGTRARHLLSADELAQAPELERLHLDVGALDRADAERRVRIGDPVVLDGPPVELLNGRLAARALDNRVGALVVLEAARRAGERGCAAEVVAVASVQEEIASYAGARAAAHGIEPDLAIVVDVTHASDVPDLDGDLVRRIGRIALGGGPVVTRGASSTRAVADRLIELAGGAGMPLQLAAEGTQTYTDADAVHETRAGVPTGIVSVPLRSMHSPSETVQLSDVEAAIELVARFCCAAHEPP